ncbi:MAG: rRNA maturation RNase YbeY, partial [Polyangia bacterium]|nr:rRNA maturation RNase YbeY [Polyangia bacterium]
MSPRGVKQPTRPVTASVKTAGNLVSLRLTPSARRIAPRGLGPRLRRRALRMLAAVGVKNADLSVLLTADAEIAELNLAWRRRRGPTDVLSFPQVASPEELRAWLLPRRSPPRGAGEPERSLGDIAISLETVQGRSPDPRAFEADLVDLLAHGLLHLLGHDHGAAAARKAMLELQA